MIENDESYCILLRCLQCQGKESQQRKVERNDGRKKMQSVSVVYYVQPIQ